MKGSIWHAKDYTDIKYDPRNYKPTDAKVPIDEDIPYIKGFVKASEYNDYGGWVKTANYDVSLYCATECGGKANDKSYECGYVRRNGLTNDMYKEVKSSAVGCFANNDVLGRTLSANGAVTDGFDSYAGGFSIGNPSL